MLFLVVITLYHLTQELQAEELEKEEICRDILNSTRNELYLGMRFLDSAFSALRPEPDTGVFVAGTDGELLRFSPDQLMKWYEKGRVEVNRLYLHMILIAEHIQCSVYSVFIQILRITYSHTFFKGSR